MIKMNLFTKQNRFTDIEDKFMVTKGKWEEFGVNINILLYINYINSKDVQNSTGNSTQYSITTYMRKESEKEQIYIYVYN